MLFDYTRASLWAAVREPAAGAPERGSSSVAEGSIGLLLRMSRSAAVLVCLFALIPLAAHGQQLLGSINGTVTDTSGAVVPGAKVTAVNTGTNLTVTATTQKNGSYNILNLPIGTYTVTISKDGFKTTVNSEVLVQSNRASTVNSVLEPGAVSSEVTVSATPLLNQTDTTNGYVLSSHLVQSTPLGTGSFTQLATLAPGVNSDPLAGSGTNAGLGNQEIWANGQRDTSNSISFNGINGNNVFNGKTSSSVGESRFVLNTNEQFLPGGQISTSTSVYDAIGQGLPTPPQETIEELHVMTSMYDASQGANSGAHIQVVTKSGTNQFHGGAYEYHQTAAWNANQFFLNAAGIPRPPLHRNTFGGLIGGPILHNKLFFFGSYQGQRVTDAFNGATAGVNVPIGLTNDRSATALAALSNTDYGTNITASQIDPVALKIMQAKDSNGNYLVPSQTISDPTQITALGYNAFEQGPPSSFNADQVNANIDYNFSMKDRFSEKYYFQHNPSTSPFAVSQTLGFPQSLNAGSQVVSLDNIVTPTANTSWEQRFGFVREFANATSAQSLTPSGVGINLFNSNFFPGFTISNPTNTVNFGGTGGELRIGPANNFANAGVFQNQFEASTTYNWIKSNQTLSFGLSWDYGQLNVINRENEVATFSYNHNVYPNDHRVSHSFSDFLTGYLDGYHDSGRLLNGETNRYYRYKQMGMFAQDQVKLRSNLTVDLGLRWDWDGPLSEKNGLLTNFYTQNYSFDLSSDTINNIGLVVAGNNKQFCAQKEPYCVSNSTLTGRQWLFEPRIGVAWSPKFVKNFVVRAGFGLYADRGEFFTEFSPSAGLGISGPFGVTTEEPFTVPFYTSCTGSNCLGNNPFGATAPTPPPSNFDGVKALVPNLAGLSGCTDPVTPTCTPTGFANFAFLFGGYDPKNTLPYSENWTLDFQWQPYNTLMLDVGYVGNHGVHQVLPIPFNQPGVATPQNPINGQIYSYGYQPLDSAGNGLVTEQVQTSIGEYSFSDGNTALRVPFVGYNPNADFNEAEGVSNYHALQIGVNKRLSKGLLITGAYTWSHALDEGSGLQLFYNGNNPLDPKSGYGTAGFDRTHVFTLSYLYQFPNAIKSEGFMSRVANGWGISGITTLESGQPFSVYDFSGSVGGIFFSADDYITNPILPIKQGTTVQQVMQQGTTGINPANPYFDATAFSIPYLQPGQSGVPPCGPTVGGTSSNFCDTVETGYGTTGRNIFRGPFQTRFDFDLFKNFKINERFSLRYDAQFFNVFNHPSFDAPNNDVSLNGCYNPQPCYTNPPPDSQGIGLIQNSLGSPRFIQMALHLNF